MRVIAHLNLCRAPCGRHLWRRFIISADTTAAASTVSAALGGNPAYWPPSCNKVGQ